MLIRKTRDGDFWMDGERADAADVAAAVALAALPFSHWEADTVSGEVRAFVERGREVDQVSGVGVMAEAQKVAARSADIVSARDARLQLEQS